MSKTNERIEKGLEPEVSITLAAADILALLTCEKGHWNLNVTDTGFDDPRRTDTNNTMREIRIFLSPIEAAAIMALFVGYGEDPLANDLVTVHLYAIAEKAFAKFKVPQNLRIIP